MGSNVTFQSRNVLSKKFMGKGEQEAPPACCCCPCASRMLHSGSPSLHATPSWVASLPLSRVPCLRSTSHALPHQILPPIMLNTCH